MFKFQYRGDPPKSLSFTFPTILIITLLASSNSYLVSDFKPSILKATPPSGYHSVSTGSATTGEILCFADVNSDQYTDYLAVQNRSILTFYLYFWNDEQSEFTRQSFNITNSTYRQYVQQAFVNDLTADGVHQLILTFSYTENTTNSSTNTTTSTTYYSTSVYKISQCSSFVCKFTQITLQNANLYAMTSVPTLINLQGNSSPSFLTFQNKKRYVIQRQSTGKYIKYGFNEFINSQNLNNSFNAINQHFAANVDINGDCHSDLVILSLDSNNKSTLQFYTKQNNNKFSSVSTLTFSQTVHFFTFADMDSSGTTDIVLVIGETGSQSIYILFNKIQQITTLCEQTTSTPFLLQNLQKITTAYPITSNLLSIGDVDSDSYPDILTIGTSSSDFKKTLLYKNVINSASSATNYKNRALKLATDSNADQIMSIKNPKQSTFFDLGEDGKLDIIIMVDEQTASSKTVITRTCFINNVQDDTLFIKILPLSSTSLYPSSSSSLTSAFGISIQWTITTLNGDKKISLLNQQPQQNYGTLQLPFIIGGLGRTNNYVQDLTVGYQGIGQSSSWSPVIPNSKLLIYFENSEWKLETLLSNTDRVNHVVYVSLAILAILGLVILGLNYRENKEDRRDQYNFIQLIR